MSVAATHDPCGHASMFALGGAYSLSKRTLRYATVAHVRNARGSNFLGREQQPGTDNDNLANPRRGHTPNGVNIGINHSFRRRVLSEPNGVNRRTA
ncbi:hypothetical protein [Burkholderia ambifaria]|uniref:hypothetical protein n=1 Tax=Burkholderia ambifaria TaxID=152480 RepID=UPI000CFECE68|nr:hypothetical protein C6Q14_32030 [Burkholderia ambifaria]